LIGGRVISEGEASQNVRVTHNGNNDVVINKERELNGEQQDSVNIFNITTNRHEGTTKATGPIFAPEMGPHHSIRPPDGAVKGPTTNNSNGIKEGNVSQRLSSLSSQDLNRPSQDEDMILVNETQSLVPENKEVGQMILD
jgi:hypothetical protein